MKLKNKLELDSTLKVGAIPTASTSNFSVLFENGGLVSKRTVGNIINYNSSDFISGISNSFPSIFNYNTSTTATDPSLVVSFKNQLAGTVLAAPATLNGTPSFRKLIDSDLSETSIFSQLGNYVTLDTEQDITGKKTFSALYHKIGTNTSHVEFAFEGNPGDSIMRINSNYGNQSTQMQYESYPEGVGFMSFFRTDDNITVSPFTLYTRRVGLSQFTLRTGTNAEVFKISGDTTGTENWFFQIPNANMKFALGYWSNNAAFDIEDVKMAVRGGVYSSSNMFANGFKKHNSSNDHVLLGQGGHKLISDFALSTDIPDVSNFVTNTRTITAGNGLTGGGNLTANRTITLGTPSSVGLTSTNSVTTSSHTHALDANTITEIGKGQEALTNIGALNSLTTTDKSSLVNAINEVNGNIPTDVGIRKTIRKNLSGAYRRAVIPLVLLDNTSISLDSYFFGEIHAKRNNILNGLLFSAKISAGKYYNSETPIVNITYGKDYAGVTFKPVTFTYNGLKYFGIDFGSNSANFTHVTIDGVSDDWSNISVVNYLDTQNNVALNQEISDSLTDYTYVSDTNNKIEKSLNKIEAEAFIKNGGNDTQMLLAGGGHRPVSDFVPHMNNSGGSLFATSIYSKSFGVVTYDAGSSVVLDTNSTQLVNAFFEFTFVFSGNRKNRILIGFDNNNATTTSNLKAWCSNPDEVLSVSVGRRIADNNQLSIIVTFKNSLTRPHFSVNSFNSPHLHTGGLIWESRIISDLSEFSLVTSQNSDFIRDNYLWNKGNFSQTDIDNWNTAFGWGDFRNYGLGVDSSVNIAPNGGSNIKSGLFGSNTGASGTPLQGSSGGYLHLRSAASGNQYWSQLWLLGNAATTPRAFISHGNGETRNADWVELYHTGNFNPAQYVLQTSLNTQLANYVPINGVTTINNTKTFTSSPIVPNGTLNGHAVNLGQLNTILGDYATEDWVNQQISDIEIPTVNNGQLSLTTGTGLTGSVNFTANQSHNSSFLVAIASTHKLPTLAEWNALPTTDTITRLRGTTSGTYTSGDLTLLAGANTTITQSGSNITIASTNTTYSAGTLALLQAGTNTSNRVWSAKILADYVMSVTPDTSNFLEKDASNEVTQDFEIVKGFAKFKVGGSYGAIYGEIEGFSEIDLGTDDGYAVSYKIGESNFEAYTSGISGKSAYDWRLGLGTGISQMLMPETGPTNRVLTTGAKVGDTTYYANNQGIINLPSSDGILSYSSANGIIVTDWNSFALSEYAISLGYGSVTSGNYATSVGSLLSTTGFGSTNQGYSNSITKSLGYALGAYNSVRATLSGVFGIGLINRNDGAFVVGRYNSELPIEPYDTTSPHKQAVFAIGAGRDETDRYTALTVYGDGRADYAEGYDDSTWTNNTLVTKKWVLDNAGGSSGGGVLYRNVHEENVFDLSLEYSTSLAEYVFNIKTGRPVVFIGGDAVFHDGYKVTIMTNDDRIDVSLDSSREVKFRDAEDIIVPDIEGYSSITFIYDKEYSSFRVYHKSFISLN